MEEIAGDCAESGRLPAKRMKVRKKLKTTNARTWKKELVFDAKREAELMRDIREGIEVTHIIAAYRKFVISRRARVFQTPT